MHKLIRSYRTYPSMTVDGILYILCFGSKILHATPYISQYNIHIFETKSEGVKASTMHLKNVHELTGIF